MTTTPPRPTASLRSALALVLAGVAMCLSAACSAGATSAPTPAVVSDAAVLDGVEPTIEATPNEPDAPTTAHFLVPNEADGALVIVEVFAGDSAYEIDAETELADGTPAEVDVGPAPRSERAVAFVAATGETVSVRSFDLEVSELVEIAQQVRPDGDDLAIDGDGWELLTSIPLPAWTDGYTTEYDLGGGRAVLLTVYRQVGDGMVLYRYGPTVDDEINGEPALRFDEVSGVNGFAFEFDDDFLVEVRDISAADVVTPDELRSIAESVRSVEPPS